MEEFEITTRSFKVSLGLSEGWIINITEPLKRFKGSSYDSLAIWLNKAYPEFTKRRLAPQY